VVFARISHALGATSYSSPQEVITNFASEENFLTTNLNGCVQTLEYSRRTLAEGAQNYFFAGTDMGLYVFADNAGNGFLVSSLSTLNAPPFSTGTWHYIPSIMGSVIDIKTSGAGDVLYVLARQTSGANPFSTKLYSIPFTTNIATMFAPSNIRLIAQTQTGIFQKVAQFTGIQIVATDDPAGPNPENKEQLFLTTNQGLYISNASQAGMNQGIASATNQTAAQWALVGDTATTYFVGIGGINTPIRQTVWPFSLADAACGARTFQEGIVYQISAIGNAGGTSFSLSPFLPTDFNAQQPAVAFRTVAPITYFFSDGARRFFVVRPLQSSPRGTRIMVSPYNVQEFNVAQPTLLYSPVLSQTPYINWVQQIGASGYLLAGTSQGILGLL
jgi:hypothetical protein